MVKLFWALVGAFAVCLIAFVVNIIRHWNTDNFVPCLVWSAVGVLLSVAINIVNVLVKI